MKNKIIFIINPVAGKGTGKRIELQIQQFFVSKNIDFETVFTEKKGHATELTKQMIQKKPDIIVACGGDGTINEVAQILVGTDVSLGIIPIGSGNGLASNLRIPKKLKEAFELILYHSKIKIDVGKINHSFFFSNIGLGIDADVIKNYSQTKTRNFLGYIKASIKSVVNYKPKNFRIEIDNQLILENSYYFLLCSNSNEAGYGISFSPNAKLNDGKLDFLLVKNISFIKQIKFSVCVLLKRIESLKEATNFQVKTLKFFGNQDTIILQVDGEMVLLNEQLIEVCVLPEALNVLIPH